MEKEITSLQNPIVKHLVKLRQNHDYRFEHKQLVVEGLKMVQELCTKKPAKVLVVVDETIIPKGVRADEILVVSEDIMEKISGVRSPEGILAEVAMPNPSDLKGLKHIVALDGINDPGNLGTLMRTALALGWEGVFIVHESCDPYNEKALRAARGATFRLPLGIGSWADLEQIIKRNKLQPLVGDTQGTEISKLKSQEPTLLVLGNEARGPSPEALRLCKKIAIPMPGAMESLNVAVAGGILMYELKARS